MKYHYKQLLFIFSIGLIASCSQSEDPGLTDLRSGRYPLELCASIDGHRSRAGMDAWIGGENIAVSLAGGDAVKYIISGPDGDAKAAEGAKPIYWEKTEEATITSWWPYSTSKQTVDVKDQSKGIEPFDFLRAEATGDYRGPVSLTFTHQMARISYTLIAGDGITAEDLDEAVVKLRGNARAVVDKGTVEAATDGVTSEITPFSDPLTHSGDVLLPPQDLSDSPMIDVTVGTNRFGYIPAEGQADLKAGLRYNYRITVSARGITVDAITGGQWTDGGSEDVASKEVKQVFTANDLKPGDYYYSDGTWSDGGLRTIYTDETYRIDATVVPDPDKTCIGIVFHAGKHSCDQSDYSATGIGQPNCHGYVVALQDATDNDYCMWGVYGTEVGCCRTDEGGHKLNYKNPDIDWCGYAWTQRIITAAGGKYNLNATEGAGYPATWYAVVSYEGKVQAPSISSGWFLPSIGQMWNIDQNRSFLFGSVSGAEGLKSDRYWSSSEDNSDSEKYAFFAGGELDKENYEYKHDRSGYVRAILAF